MRGREVALFYAEKVPCCIFCPGKPISDCMSAQARVLQEEQRQWLLGVARLMVKEKRYVGLGMTLTTKHC